MKKKLLILVLAICLTFSMSLTAFAEDNYIYEGNAHSVLEYREPSYYCILIPERIDMNDGTGYRFQADMLNICEGEKVFVSITNLDENNRLLFTHEDGKTTFTKSIYSEVRYGVTLDNIIPQKCVGYFDGDDTTSKVLMKLGADTYDYDVYVKAGNYTATADFEINISY